MPSENRVRYAPDERKTISICTISIFDASKLFTSQTDHGLPDLDRTNRWIGTYVRIDNAYPTDHHVGTCTDHIDRTRSE